MNIYTLLDLQAAFQRKAKLKYVYFWGHTPKQKASPTKSCSANGIPLRLN